MSEFTIDAKVDATKLSRAEMQEFLKQLEVKVASEARRETRKETSSNPYLLAKAVMDYVPEYEKPKKKEDITVTEEIKKIERQRLYTAKAEAQTVVYPEAQLPTDAKFAAEAARLGAKHSSFELLGPANPNRIEYKAA
jgi:hypothetical protein